MDQDHADASREPAYFVGDLVLDPEGNYAVIEDTFFQQSDSQYGDSDDEDGTPLAEGQYYVSCNDGSGAILLEDSLTLQDRTFQPMSYVVRVNSPSSLSSQVGVVLGSRQRLLLSSKTSSFADTSEPFWVDGTHCISVLPFYIGARVLVEGDVGHVTECSAGAIIKFDDGSVCVHPDCSKLQVVDDQGPQDIFPGQRVMAPMRAWTKAIWLKGQRSLNQFHGVVVHMLLFSINVRWFHASGGASELPLRSLASPEECESLPFIQTVSDTANNSEANNGFPQLLRDANMANDLVITCLKFDFDKLRTEATSSESNCLFMEPQSFAERYAQFSEKVARLYRSSITSRTTISSGVFVYFLHEDVFTDFNPTSSVLDLSPYCAQVLATQNYVDILWQDGTCSIGERATKFRPIYDTVNRHCIPGNFVKVTSPFVVPDAPTEIVPSSSQPQPLETTHNQAVELPSANSDSALEDTSYHGKRSTGIVLKYSSADRTVTIKWLDAESWFSLSGSEATLKDPALGVLLSRLHMGKRDDSKDISQVYWYPIPSILCSNVGITLSTTETDVPAHAREVAENHDMIVDSEVPPRDDLHHLVFGRLSEMLRSSAASTNGTEELPVFDISPHDVPIEPFDLVVKITEFIPQTDSTSPGVNESDVPLNDGRTGDGSSQVTQTRTRPNSTTSENLQRNNCRMVGEVIWIDPQCGRALVRWSDGTITGEHPLALMQIEEPDEIDSSDSDSSYSEDDDEETVSATLDSSEDSSSVNQGYLSGDCLGSINLQSETHEEVEDVDDVSTALSDIMANRTRRAYSVDTGTTVEAPVSATVSQTAIHTSTTNTLCAQTASALQHVRNSVEPSDRRHFASSVLSLVRMLAKAGLQPPGSRDVDVIAKAATLVEQMGLLTGIVTSPTNFQAALSTLPAAPDNLRCSEYVAVLSQMLASILQLPIITTTSPSVSTSGTHTASHSSVSVVAPSTDGAETISGESLEANGSAASSVSVSDIAVATSNGSQNGDENHADIDAHVDALFAQNENCSQIGVVWARENCPTDFVAKNDLHSVDPACSVFSHSLGSSGQRALHRELRTMRNSLPQGALLQTYSDMPHRLRAVISGPSSTPYSGVLFAFDLTLPRDYPNSPPTVYYHCDTSQRMHPNLYVDGNVCLSLLGTWNGKGNQLWMPAQSTLLQLIVSIQGLILVPYPYYCEAGYERQQGTAEGDTQARNFNESSYLLGLQSVCRQVEKPLDGLSDVIHQYYGRVGPKILEAARGVQRYISVKQNSSDDLEIADFPETVTRLVALFPQPLPSKAFNRALTNGIAHLETTLRTHLSC